MPNIVLIGYRGTGKSTVAKRVARTLNWPIAEMDSIIVKRAGATINELVKSRGWAHFRDLEQALCEELTRRDNVVIDCGGGAVEREANIRTMRNTGTVFWLRATPETIIERISGDVQRPSLTGTKSSTEEITEVLARRTPLYAAASHVQLPVDGRSPADIAKQIVELWPRVRL